MSIDNEILQFKANASIELAHRLCKTIISLESSSDEKRSFFGDIFRGSYFSDDIEALLNLWTIAVMLEHPTTAIVDKIAASRDLLKDKFLTDKDLNEWILYVFKGSSFVPQDLKQFLASDFRNLAKDRLSQYNLDLLQSF